MTTYRVNLKSGGHFLIRAKTYGKLHTNLEGESYLFYCDNHEEILKIAFALVESPPIEQSP